MTISVSSIKRATTPMTACARCHQERGTTFAQHCKDRPCGWWRCPNRQCGWINGKQGAIRGGTT